MMRLNVHLISFDSQNGIAVVVESWDQNTFVPSNLIDRFCFNTKDPKLLQTQTLALKGRRALLLIKIRVSCEAGFYGKRCNIHCQFTNNNRYERGQPRCT